MRSFSRLLLLVAEWFESKSEQSHGKVAYRPCGEVLETKKLQSSFSIGAAVPTLSRTANGQSLHGPAEVFDIKAAHAAKDNSDSSAAVPVSYHSHTLGARAADVATSVSAQGSGKVDPLDPGGVELVRTADSGKVDPLDPGGVEL
jgi:hypothetical protein